MKRSRAPWRAPAEGAWRTRFVVIGARDQGRIPALLADEAGRDEPVRRTARDLGRAGRGRDRRRGRGLLSAPAAESPVIAIAGALRKTSALLKLAEAHQLR